MASLGVGVGVAGLLASYWEVGGCPLYVGRVVFFFSRGKYSYRSYNSEPFSFQSVHYQYLNYMYCSHHPCHQPPSITITFATSHPL